MYVHESYVRIRVNTYAREPDVLSMGFVVGVVKSLLNPSAAIYYPCTAAAYLSLHPENVTTIYKGKVNREKRGSKE